MVLSSAFLAAKDGLAKSFLDQVSPMQMIWTQYAGLFVVLALAAASRHGWKVLQPTPVGGQFIRGCLSAAAVVTLYWALTYIPLADATAVYMLAPLVAALLAPIALGERLNLVRLGAVGVGFAGVVVILKPGFGGSSTGYYIALFAGVLFGCYFLANRRLAGSQAPLLNVLYNGLMGAIALTLLAPLYWKTPAWHTVPKLGGIIALAVAGQGLMITAFHFAPAAVVAPFSYTLLLFAALIGFLAFGTLPDAMTWVGIVLIVGAGLFIVERERKADGKAELARSGDGQHHDVMAAARNY